MLPTNNVPYKHGSEDASSPKYIKILNMAQLWIWQGSQYASVKQINYKLRCLDYFLFAGYNLFSPEICVVLQWNSS